MKLNDLSFRLPAMAAAVVFAGSLASAADITGTITLKGAPPPEKEIIEFKSDVNCGPLRTGVPRTRFYVAGPHGELADVFVSIKGLSGKSTGEQAPPAVIDQSGCEYLPYVQAIQTNQKLVVRNSDPVLHNVHATPTAPGNKEENKAMMPKGPDITFSFAKPENFLRFKCDVHPWMFAYVCVADHPYFSVSGKDGAYRIANVPPGKYTIEAIHRKAGSVTQEVEVKVESLKLDFTIELK